MIRTRTGCALATLLLCLLTAPAGAALKIEVLRGEGANNNAATNRVTSPVVRVFDGNGPLPGALVVFTAPATGASVVFAGSGEVGQAISDESGTAASPRVQPVGGNGPVSIRVMASKNREFADVLIHQMNLGFSENVAHEAELNIVRLSLDEDAGRGQSFRVRIDDGNDLPVPRAVVVFVLRKMEKSGKAVPLWRIQLVSDERGEARCPVAKGSGGGRIDLEVRAEIEGRSATRYFP